jgi:hypothetical protein
MREKRSETYSVIGGTRLLAKRNEPVLLRGIVFDKLLTKALPNHPIANDDDVFLSCPTFLARPHHPPFSPDFIDLNPIAPLVSPHPCLSS